jgi:hypothetical protein
MWHRRCPWSVPLPPRMRGQDVHVPEIVKINRREFPAGWKFAGIRPDSGRQRVSLQDGGQPRGEITQWDRCQVISAGSAGILPGSGADATMSPSMPRCARNETD